MFLASSISERPSKLSDPLTASLVPLTVDAAYLTKLTRYSSSLLRSSAALLEAILALVLRFPATFVPTLPIDAEIRLFPAHVF